MSRILRALVVALAFALAFASPVSAAGFRIVDLLNGKTRPDKPGEAFSLFSTPSIAGNRVVFLTHYYGTLDAIWSLDLKTGSVRKLVGLQTRVPGGRGRFVCFCLRYAIDDVTPRVGSDTVAFFGMDQKDNIGLYTVPIAGGTVRRIASSLMTAPDGSRFVRFGWGASLAAAKITFYAETQAPHYGIYTAGLDGSGLSLVIDETTGLDARKADGTTAPGYYTQYRRTVIGRSGQVFTASGLFDPVSGANAIFQAPSTLLADHLTRLAGGAGTHVRIGLVSAPIGIGGLVFTADEPEGGYAGIFRRTSPASAQVYASTKDKVPNASGPYQAFNAICADRGGVAFAALADGRANVYFVPGVGKATVRVAGQGATYYKLTVGDRCLSGGRIVFREDGGANRLLLAIPK